MNKWNGYIHTNGRLIVKRVWGKSSIECTSPFVQAYLGEVFAGSREEAVRLLMNKARGVV